MITEVMTLLIAVGAVMVFVVWNQSKKRRQKVEERREVEESTGKLKQELEKTATEIIGRMESQVSNLEDLLDEAEKNRTALEGRVAELKKLLKRSEGQSTEIRDLLAKLEEADETVEELQRKLEAAEKKISMQMQMSMPMQTMMPMSTPMMSPMMTSPMMTTPMPNVPSPISPPPILSNRTSTTAKATVSTATTKIDSTTKKSPATTPTKTDDNNDFEKMLKKSMDSSDNVDKKPVARVPDRRSIVVSSKSSQRTNVIEKKEPVKIDSQLDSQRINKPATSNVSATAKDNAARSRTADSAKIKNMLLEGMTVEDIARETGVGRGAIELIQEMTRRKLERK